MDTKNAFALTYPRILMCQDTGSFLRLTLWEEYEALDCVWPEDDDGPHIVVRMDNGQIAQLPPALFLDTGRYPEPQAPPKPTDPALYADDPDAGIF